jgi:hypothetical protein
MKPTDGLDGFRGIVAGLALTGVVALGFVAACTIDLPNPTDPTPSTTTTQPPIVTPTTIPPPTSTTAPKPWLVPDYTANYYAPQVTSDPCVFASMAWLTPDRADMANGVSMWVPKSVTARDADNKPLGALTGKDGLWSMPAVGLPTRFWVDVVRGTNVFIYCVMDKGQNATMKPVVK